MERLFHDHCKNLLRIKGAKNPKGKEVEKSVKETFQSIINRRNSSERKVITNNIVTKTIKKMKTRKAADWQGWKAKWIKNRGLEMVKSLRKLYNRMEIFKKAVQDQWNKIFILSTKKDPRRTLGIREGFSSPMLSEKFMKR